MRIRLLHLVLILAVHCRYVAPATEKFSQKTVELLPCSGDLSTNVSLYNSTMITVPANFSHCKNETDQHNVTMVSWTI